MKRLAIVSSHPVQYNAPWFELLAQAGIAVKAYYTQGPTSDKGSYDEGFGKVIKWDIPLLDGYEYSFVKNVATHPGTGHFKGIINPTLNEEIAAWRPDAILVIGWSFVSHLKCMRHFHGKVPVLFRGDSTLIDEQPGLKRFLRRLFLIWVYRHVDFALYVGSNNKAYFLKHRVPEKRLVFSPHAIDNTRFIDTTGTLADQASKWRKELGYNPNDILVVFAGKLEPKKNPAILLDLADRLRINGIKFLFVGNGELEQALKMQAASLPNVRFIDFQNQKTMPLVYRLADIFVLPSQGPGETWGLALNEAMASGVSVIASDKVGGAVDLIRPGENGYIFKSGNVEDLQRVVELMIKDDKFRAMAFRSAELIKDWSFQHIITSIYTTVQEL